MLQLVCHHEMRGGAVDLVSADVGPVDGGKLRLCFHVAGRLSKILVPGPEKPVRTGNLWTKTCFELFLGRPNMAEYIEFNLSPSGQWAAYQFADYRQGMVDMDMSSGPNIGCRMGQFLILECEVALPPKWQDQELQANISAIIEQEDGQKSYWALAHPDGPPDFHDRHCFIHRIKAAENL